MVKSNPDHPSKSYKYHLKFILHHSQIPQFSLMQHPNSSLKNTMPRRSGGGGRRRRRSERDDDDEEEDELPEKRRASLYFDEMAEESSGDYEEEDGDEEDDDGFLVRSEDDITDEYEFVERVPKPSLVDRRDEEEMDVAAMEKMINERYGSRVSYDEDFEEEVTEVEQQTLLPSVRDPKLWLVKCLPGRERELAAFLMQKSLEKDSKSNILSVVALDHLKSYIYVESFCQTHVMQACKGVRNVFARSVTMVPLKEMRNVLSVEPHDRTEVHVSRGDWVRLKRSSYKGDLAKVVDVDTVKHKVTVKVTPKLNALTLSDKLEGVDYLYKTVALSSVVTGDIHPSIQEVENFREIGEADADMATLFEGKEKGCWMRGDAVVVVKGDLKNLKGFVEYVEGDIVHIRPTEKIPLKTVAVHRKELAKYFEPGCQVKVISGQLEGATGMVVKVDQNKLVILSDASKDLITVFSVQVMESNETSETRTKVGISDCFGFALAEFHPLSSFHSPQALMLNCHLQYLQQNSSASKSLPQPEYSSCKSFSGSRSSSTLARVTGNTWKRHDSFIGSKVKILHGPYKGYRGCVKGVNGRNVRVELEAQMKVITVERIHISDKVPVSNTSYNMPQQWTGRETPLHTRTPLHSMGGETPWRTPFRSPHPSTPIHHGSRESTHEKWNPFSMTSPSRLVSTP